ncbi:MAG TPA: NADPH-dependent F420 reductase [Candidatus Acidoferrum sp.]|nr:NADPH-dependent F420 reductase [Candidatus Acidoferrum sp.]
MNRKIGILGGTGPEGSGLAYRWAKAGEAMVIGSREATRATEAADRLRTKIGGMARIEGMENAAVVEQCEIVVLTIPFSGHAELLKQLKKTWKPGTLVIDTTVPLAATVGGPATRMLGVWQGSAAEQAKELLPAGVHLAAAFQNLGSELLSSDEMVDCDILVCSDDEEARRVTSELAGKIAGARAVNAGKLENARIVESLTALLIGINIRYKVRGAGIRVTGLPIS